MSVKIYLFFCSKQRKTWQNTGIVEKQCMVIRGWTFPSMRFKFENCVDILNVDFGSVSILDSGDVAGQRL